ncbi:MAG: hypothetical protein U5N58_06620 [Actinomycetota bacterium]|nr:hypothetical protein [Actinomycetota bacterium]
MVCGETYVITETDPGSCWNVEVSDPGITGVTPDSGNRSVTIAATPENIDGLDGANVFTFTNTRKTATVTIGKRVVNSDADIPSHLPTVREADLVWEMEELRL